jgi:hypothetical protein
MRPGAAKTRFLKRLAEAGLSLSELTPLTGVEAMLSYYAEERADSCDPNDDGDMLLFQWGTNDWGDGPAFEVNIIRQFIDTEADDDTPRQLSLMFRFDSAVALARLKSGNKWCGSPSELAAFRQFVSSTKTLRAVGQELPASVELRYARTCS